MMIVDVLLFGLKNRIIEEKIAFIFIRLLPSQPNPLKEVSNRRKRKTLIDTRPNARVNIMKDNT